MKEANTISIDACVNALDMYDSVIDVRTPDEFELDHLPGAINLPILTNDERQRVGTINAQQSSFDANRIGAALVSTNIGRILSYELNEKARDWRPLIYCWRGGNRSASLATVLARIGYRVDLLEGGYRAYRRWVVQSLPTYCEQQFRVIAGRTGSGKTHILQACELAGAQVLDLEAIANHRGSVLGLLPQTRQPSQKQFDSDLRVALSRLDTKRPVYVESESRKIGQVQIPEALINAIRSSPCHIVEMPVQSRAQFLLSDYPHFVSDPNSLITHLERLTALHGTEKIDRWKRQINDTQWSEFVSDILSSHYDPSYDKSMQRNFGRLDQANRVTISSAVPSNDDFTNAARRIIDWDQPAHN